MISSRGLRLAQNAFGHGKLDLYDASTNPQGTIGFAGAENHLSHQDLVEYMNNKITFTRDSCSYGEGYTGSARLRTALASHLNEYFSPVIPFNAEEITFAAGVTSLNEVCALVTCDPDAGDSIMLGQTVYGAFGDDLTMRTGIKLEYVDTGDTDQFGPDCVAKFEAGIDDAKKRGVNVRAIILCNPHNPLGQCYPRETLVGLLRLCAAKGIHLISDEIYALSVYGRPDREPESFTSIRSIDFDGLIDPRQVHILYGMSKDYGAGGLRLGCIISQNPDFVNAVRAVGRFASPSQLSMQVAVALLEDRTFVKAFLEQSRNVLQRSRLLAEELLDAVGIEYHRKGNAGFFMWIDLSPFLPLSETNGDSWAAERLLSERLIKAGIGMSRSEAFRAPNPGRFRLVFCLPEDHVREGVRRLIQVLGIK